MKSFLKSLIAVLMLVSLSMAADLRLQYGEKIRGANAPGGLEDTANRLTNVEHDTDGSHKKLSPNIRILKAGESLATVIAEYPSAEVTFLITDNVISSGTVTVPSNIGLRFEKPGKITKSGSGTLTINGPFSAGSYQVFTGFGAGDVTGLKGINPKWFGTLNTAITVISTSAASIKLDYAETLTANLTIPATCGLEITKDGSITKASTYTLTINGPFSAGLYQVFFGFDVGNVTFGQNSIDVIYIQWFGAKGDNSTDCTQAITNAVAALGSVDGGIIRAPAGIYLYDSLILSGRAKILEGVSQGATGLTTGVQFKARSIVTNFTTITNSNGIQIKNIYFNGNNKATNVVRISDFSVDDTLDNVTIDGCVNGGVNLNLTPITPNVQVSELKFYGVNLAGRAGGANITNLLISSNQSVVLSFYSLKSFGNNNDVDYGVHFVQGEATFYTPFFAGNKLNDIKTDTGNMVIIDGRSESAIDSINIASGTGVTNLINYTHGATTAVTTLIIGSSFTGTINVVGGTYTNIANTSNSCIPLLMNPTIYAGGAIYGAGKFQIMQPSLIQIATTGQFSLSATSHHLDTGNLYSDHAIYPGTPALSEQTASGMYAGTGIPNNAQGNNGDFYLRSDGGALTTIYQKRSGSWVGIL